MMRASSRLWSTTAPRSDWPQSWSCNRPLPTQTAPTAQVRRTFSGLLIAAAVLGPTVPLAVMTVHRSADWGDEVRLWQTAVVVNPRNHNNFFSFGDSIMKDGNAPGNATFPAVNIVYRVRRLAGDPPLWSRQEPFLEEVMSDPIIQQLIADDDLSEPDVRRTIKRVRSGLLLR